MPLCTDRYGLDTVGSSSASALPFATAAVSCAVAGGAADALVARGVPLSTVRKLATAVGTLGPAAALLALAFGREALTFEGAEALFVGALGLHAFHTAGYAVGPQDLARRTTALISGITDQMRERRSPSA